MASRAGRQRERNCDFDCDCKHVLPRFVPFAAVPTASQLKKFQKTFWELSRPNVVGTGMTKRFLALLVFAVVSTAVAAASSAVLYTYDVMPSTDDSLVRDVRAE